MWFSLFALVLILAVTFFQGLQGMFTALIMCVQTILSAALAFGLYDNVYSGFLASSQPDHGQAIALMAIFIVTLLVLRTLTDVLITGDMQFSVYVERVGGGAFGFVTAMVLIGTLAIGFQMLPFNPQLLGFERYTLTDTSKGEAEPARANVKATAATKQTGRPVEYDKKALAGVAISDLEESRNDLWLSPDAFTLALVSHLSNYALQGTNRFSDDHPDLLDEVHRFRADFPDKGKVGDSADGGTSRTDKNAGAAGSASGSRTPQKDRSRRRVDSVGLSDTAPFFGDDLPFELTSYSALSTLEKRGSSIQSGHILVRLDTDWLPAEADKPLLDSFDVPRDRRLLQLRVDKLQPGSWLGRALGRARDVVGQKYLIDKSGKKYPPYGIYAMAKVGSRRYFELICLDEDARNTNARIPEFNKIKSRHLKGDYTYAFLYLVPPGTEPRELQTGGPRPIDLGEFPLVAPE